MTSVPIDKLLRKIKNIKGVQPLLVKVILLKILLMDADLPRWDKRFAWGY
jgi:hypothetical protein